MKTKGNKRQILKTTTSFFKFLHKLRQVVRGNENIFGYFETKPDLFSAACTMACAFQWNKRCALVTRGEDLRKREKL